MLVSPKCRTCKRALSATPLRQVAAEATCTADRAPFVPVGCLFVSDGETFTASEGWLAIHIADGQNLSNHVDVRRLAGCCGLDGCDGPNKVCVCGAEVAIERSDCWMPHALLLDPATVDLVCADPAPAE